MLSFIHFCQFSIQIINSTIPCSYYIYILQYRIRQNFRGGKLSRLCTKHIIHWKTFAVHQAHAIMYCTRQMIQGENFHDWLKNCESFPPRKFCRIRYIATRCSVQYINILNQPYCIVSQQKVLQYSNISIYCY